MALLPTEHIPLLLYCALASCMACILSTYQYCADHELHAPAIDAADVLRVRARLRVSSVLRACTLLSSVGHMYTLLLLMDMDPGPSPQQRTLNHTSALQWHAFE